VKSISQQNNLRADLAASPLWRLVAEMWICVARIIAQLWKQSTAEWHSESSTAHPPAFNSRRHGEEDPYESAVEPALLLT